MYKEIKFVILVFLFKVTTAYLNKFVEWFRKLLKVAKVSKKRDLIRPSLFFRYLQHHETSFFEDSFHLRKEEIQSRN
jgi:hypothetical protein